MQVLIESVDGNALRKKERILVTCPQMQERPGQLFRRKIHLQGILRLPEEQRNPRCFDYRLYLKSEGIFYQMTAAGYLLACLIGAALGSVNGLVITYGKVAPFIATLATMTIFRGLTLVYTNGNPISSLSEDDRFLEFGQGYVAGLPVPAIMMLIMFFILWFILHKTPLGRKTYAVGGNEKVSFIAGIKINRIKIFAYTVTGLLCGMAGAILTSRLNSAQPTAGTGYELDAIAAVVLGGTSLSGGKGRIFGTIIGALIIGTLNNGLNILNVSSFYQQVVKGIVILLAVLMDRKKN